MALLLRRRGILKVRPLEGGLESWRKLGFPMQGGGATPAPPTHPAEEAATD